MTSYLIKVILCSGVLLIAYKIILEQDRFHSFKRFYLLMSFGLSFCIPFIKFPNFSGNGLTKNDDILVYSNFLPSQKSIEVLSMPEQPFDISKALFIVYPLITIALLIRFALNLRAILKRAKSQKPILYKKSHIILINEDTSPHSFLNYIFINREEYNHPNFRQQILTHEYAHINQKHSFDIVFFELAQIVFWFNPFLFFYASAVKLNHEFLADEAVIKEHQDVPNYQYLLIEKATKISDSLLASQFNYSITKKRLLMMNKTKSLSKSLLRQLTIIPVLALSVSFFSSKSFSQKPSVTPKTEKEAVQTTSDGASAELLNEFNKIVSKIENETGRARYNSFTEQETERLQTIYLAMNEEQKAAQIISFKPAPPPLPRAVPSQTDFKKWHDSKIYGIWIDGKRVENSVLNNYKNTDFDNAYVSKLAKNAFNYGKHYYQIDLMTKKEYKAYYNEAMNKTKKYFMFIQRPTK